MESVVVPSPVTTADKPGAVVTPPAAESTASGKPAWLPEKFWKDNAIDQEGLAKSYTELESSRTKVAQTPEEKVIADKAAADKAVADAAKTPAPQSEIPGVTKEIQDRATKELAEGQTLSEQTYADLAKAGYSKTTVDKYIKGIQADEAAGAATVIEMKALAGGEGGYAAMTAWMESSLTPAEIAGYNKSMNSQDKAVIELAVRGMHAKYAKVNGNDPNLLGGNTGNVNAGDVYTSVAQLTADQRNPLYKSDEAFRQTVRAKLSRSNIL